MTDKQPNLGLATTRQLLDELRTRIAADYASGGGGLEYSTVHGRPGRWRPIDAQGNISPTPAPEPEPEPEPVPVDRDDETGPPEEQR